ncbi:MAG TPA: hypothetical protein VK166_15610 [Chitinophagaceae bacterium]|nr:hypothetical protein [Chitinophagaceae bacterium]
MKVNHKHIILALMVLIASAPFLLPGSLMVQRAMVIHEMNETLESSVLEVVEAEAASVKWYRHGKECWIDNRLFDVKEIRTEGDKIYLTGLFDDKEKDILESMGSVSAQLPQETERTNLIFQITHLDIENTSLPEFHADRLLTAVYPIQEIHFTHSFNRSVFLPPELI